jgi:hypothetical protein
MEKGKPAAKDGKPVSALDRLAAMDEEEDEEPEVINDEAATRKKFPIPVHVHKEQNREFYDKNMKYDTDVGRLDDEYDDEWEDLFMYRYGNLPQIPTTQGESVPGPYVKGEPQWLAGHNGGILPWLKDEQDAATEPVLIATEFVDPRPGDDGSMIRGRALTRSFAIQASSVVNCTLGGNVGGIRVCVDIEQERAMAKLFASIPLNDQSHPRSLKWLKEQVPKVQAAIVDKVHPDNQNTPVMLAALHGDMNSTIGVLHGYGANLDLQDGQGRSACHGAVQGQHPHVIKRLFKLGADCALRDTGGMLPAHYAATQDKMPCLKMLATLVPQSLFARANNG